jgi:hypothetical protein
MSANRYFLDESAARKLSRLLRSPLPALGKNYRHARNPELTFAKIEAHEGAGLYKAIEVFWDGANWVNDSDISRKFGTAYGTPPIKHLANSVSEAVDSIVRIFPVYIKDATSLPVWVFQEGSTSAYTGPFAVTYSGTTLTVGATRGGGVVDYIIVHPELLSKAAAETSAGVAAAGILYYTIVRGFLAAGGGAASATLAYAAGLPTNTETTMYVPLATVTFAGGAITGVRQQQYGNIIIDKTVDVFCP